jgi:hypothetical protein
VQNKKGSARIILQNPLFSVVPEARLELAHPCGRKILSPETKNFNGLNFLIKIFYFWFYLEIFDLDGHNLGTVLRLKN